MADPAVTPEDVISACLTHGLTVATGESITAGLLAASLAQVAGCSSVLRGGVVAYHVDVKQALLDVSGDDLDHGVVSDRVAAAMAIGAARVMAADLGVGTTGVAGPDAHDGEPVGSVWIAVAGPRGVRTEHLQLTGERNEIRRQTVVSCCELLAEVIADLAGPGGPAGNGRE